MHAAMAYNEAMQSEHLAVADLRCNIVAENGMSSNTDISGIWTWQLRAKGGLADY